MNAGALILLLAVQLVAIGAGVAGYWLRHRSPRVGLALGVLAIVLGLGAVFIGLWQYWLAAIAAGIVGAAAIARPRSPVAARWMLVAGSVAWLLGMYLVLTY